MAMSYDPTDPYVAHVRSKSKEELVEELRSRDTIIRRIATLETENAALKDRLAKARALADILGSALPEYEPTEDDRDKAWFSIEWVRSVVVALDAFRATDESR